MGDAGRKAAPPPRDKRTVDDEIDAMQMFAWRDVRFSTQQFVSTLCLCAAAAALLLSPQAQARDDVHIWIRAFVPDSVPGLSNFAAPLPGNPAQFFIKASDGECLSTDGRGWSDEQYLAARLSSDFHLMIEEGVEPAVQPSLETVHSTSPTRLIDCQSGQELAMNPAPLLADAVGTLGQTDSKTQVAVLAAIPDPQRPWSSATINYDATFTYDSQSHTLEFQATTGMFPAYEAYATLNDGPVVTVFRSGPIRRSQSADQASKADGGNVEVKGSVNLSVSGKRPKPPTNLTVQ